MVSEAGRVTPPPRGADPESAPPGQQTLSQLLARILDQLSVSAWLPAGVLVFLMLVTWNIRIAPNGDVSMALEHITEMNLASFALLFGAVILTTVVIQAFEFEAIRFLEGYWGPGRSQAAVAEWRCRRHLAKRNRLRARQAELERQAFPQARIEMLRSRVPKPVVDIIEGEETDNPIQSPSRQDQLEADSLWFMDYATPEERRRHADLALAQKQYPPDHLILPTRLGNTLRAYESRLPGSPGVDLENRVRAVLHQLPLTMRTEHAWFRSRLDLYCSIVVVLSLSGAAGMVVVGRHGPDCVAAVGVPAAILTWLSYRAAISSAREYGRVLKAIAGFQPSGGPAGGSTGAANSGAM